MKLQTIYEYFKEYNEETINNIILNLSEEEKELVKERYGEDLYNPISCSTWNKEKTAKFYGTLIPKIKRLLDKTKIEEVTEKKEIDKTTLLIDLIKKGSTSDTICEVLKCDSRELYEELLKLKNRGITFDRKYYSNGDIQYKSVATMQELKTNNIIQAPKKIITDINQNELKVLLISDLHFGNEYERIDLINKAFEYCVKNGINTILCGGDFIDGSFSKEKQKITNLYSQAEYFIKNYPSDKNILTFGVAGDHDLSAFYDGSVNLIEICNNYRHDIIIGGYNNALLNIKNDKLHLFHHTNNGKIYTYNAPIILHGHSHNFNINTNDDVLNVTIPTLSNIGQEFPTALEMTLVFNNGYVANTIIKQVYFGDKDIILNEFEYTIPQKNIKMEEIKNVENIYQDVKKKTLGTTRGMSQIEKFNMRYDKLRDLK